MTKFRKKPVVIEATQWKKHGDHPEVCALSDSIKSFGCPNCHSQKDVHGYVDTLEGGHIVCPGDFIITGVKGEVYPCKPDIFEATYETVSSDAPFESALTTCIGLACRLSDDGDHKAARDIDLVAGLIREQLGEIVDLRRQLLELRARIDPMEDSGPSSSEGARRITAERQRQILEENWSPEHDDGHRYGDLSVHAAALAVYGTDAKVIDPLGRGSIHSDIDEDDDCWGLQKKHGSDEIRSLEIAGALIAAEIDRFLRDRSASGSGEGR